MILQEDEFPSGLTLECRTMPESYSPLALAPSRTWWRDPARRLQFIVISLIFAFFALLSLVTSVPDFADWQTPVLAVGIAVAYAGLVIQQWRVEWGVAIVAAGLAIAGLSASYALFIGYPLVCWQVYVISANLRQRRRMWLALALVGSFAALVWQVIADRVFNPLFTDQPGLGEVLRAPDFWIFVAVTGLLIVVSVALCWQFGKQSQQRREAVANLAARAELATVSERNRIAREMHDIVAHSLTVVIAQADGGRYAGRKDPAKAIEALETISERGREALTQMRSLLSVLHEGDDRATTSTPGISGLQELVSDAKRSGAKASLTVEGEEAPVDEATGLTIYRVVQESLTNVLKHAGPVEARVRLVWGEGRVTVMVDNAPGEDTIEGSGRGLTGIKERVRIHGGRATWGPSVLFPGGWNVTAVIPLGS